MCFTSTKCASAGHYVVHRDGMIFVEMSARGSATSGDFARDASWIVRKDIYFDGFTSFESVYRPGRQTLISVSD